MPIFWSHLPKKKSCFSKLIVKKCQFKFVSFCMQGQSGVEIKIRDHSHSWTRFDTTNPMVVSDLTNELSLKIIFFEVSPIVLICVKFQ